MELRLVMLRIPVYVGAKGNKNTRNRTEQNRTENAKQYFLKKKKKGKEKKKKNNAPHTPRFPSGITYTAHPCYHYYYRKIVLFIFVFTTGNRKRIILSFLPSLSVSDPRLDCSFLVLFPPPNNKQQRVSVYKNSLIV